MSKKWSKAQLLDIVRLRYEQDLAISEIAASRGISEATADRMLREARNQHLYHLKVVTDSDSTELQRIKKYLLSTYKQLRNIYIAVGSEKCFDTKRGDFYRNEVVSNVAALAAKVLSSHLKPDLTVAVGAGEMVRAIVSAVRVPSSLPDLHIVPLTGYLSPRHTEVSANLIGGMLEQQVQGRFHWLPVVGMVEKVNEVKNVVRKLPIVQDTLKQQKHTKLVLTSIGAVDHDYIVNFNRTRSYLGRERLIDYAHAIKRNRPAGVIGASWFDRDGQETEPLLSVIGMELSDIKRIINTDGTVIAAVAAANPRRVSALQAALRGGLCSILVTDHCTAKSIYLREMGGDPPLSKRF